jgi:hypothetical protein
MVATPRFLGSLLFTTLVASGLLLPACSGGEDGKGGGDDSSSASDGTGSGGTSSSDGSSSDSSSSDGSSSDGPSSDGSSSDGSTNTGSGGTSSDSTTDSTTGTSSTGAGGATVLDPLELCGGVCQCGNGIDDDDEPPDKSIDLFHCAREYTPTRFARAKRGGTGSDPIRRLDNRIWAEARTGWLPRKCGARWRTHPPSDRPE